MKPETNIVSKCCGDRLCVKNEDEGTCYYECFSCKKPCDGAENCADCFPQHFPEEKYKNKTVPICEKHAKAIYTVDKKKSPDINHSINDKTTIDDRYATLIGGIILGVGNLYNENRQDITLKVAEYIYKNYLK